MDIKHKIVFVIGATAAVAGASFGGYTLYTHKDNATASDASGQPNQDSSPKRDSETSSSSIAPESSTQTTPSTAPDIRPTVNDAPPSTQPSQQVAPAPTTITQTPVPAPTPMPVIYTYRNGTYTAVRTYDVPNGDINTITIVMTIQNDKVLALNSSHNADASNKSLQFIDPFESGLCSAVCGQSLANLNPSRIGGASLTTTAFDGALDTIRANARA